MKLITNNSQTWTDENLIIYAQKTEIGLVKVWATNSDDWMDILKVTTYIIVVGMWIILFTLLAMFRLTAFDWCGFYFLESGYASNYPKVNKFIYFEVETYFNDHQKHCQYKLHNLKNVYNCRNRVN